MTVPITGFILWNVNSFERTQLKPRIQLKGSLLENNLLGSAFKVHRGHYNYKRREPNYILSCPRTWQHCLDASGSAGWTKCMNYSVIEAYTRVLKSWCVAGLDLLQGESWTLTSKLWRWHLSGNGHLRMLKKPASWEVECTEWSQHERYYMYCGL